MNLSHRILSASVSIGAITAVLLARPAPNLKPLVCTETFSGKKITVSDLFSSATFAALRIHFLATQKVFVPHFDYYALPIWTNLIARSLSARHLSQLVDLKALADPKATPGLLVSATDVEAGQIQ